MAISEIEKLERRFAENPQGLTFAPLAEAYRKSGDPERALGILRPGLELHPDYIPASIVLGRCLLDLGNDGEAEAAFAHVVSLDPENVIALKGLADITERAGRYDAAASRLRQLLEVDRSNDEAQAQLDRVLAAKAAFDAEPRASVVDETPLVMESASSAFGGVVEESVLEEVVVEETHVEEVALPPEPEPPAPPAPFDFAAFGSSVLADEPLQLDARTEPDLPPVVDEPAAAEPDPIFGLLAADEPVPADEIAVEPLVGEDLALEAQDRGEFQIPSASDDLAAEEVSAAESLASEFQLPDASSELIVLDASAASTEFQVPDASSSLLADLTHERTEPPVDAPVVEEVAAEVVEPVPFFEAPEPVFEVAAVEETVIEVFSLEEPVAEEPVGMWDTWADAALDPDAEPFPAPEPATPPEPVAVVEPVAVAAPEPEIAPEPEVVASAPEPEPEAVAPEPVVEPDIEPDLVVTESMAELFVRQGHASDALRIYRELAGRRPGDARLVARIAELEAVEAAARAPAAPYAARVTGGVSVRDLMRSILAARPDVRAPSAATASASAPDAARPVEPTRPAQDAISLSDVFGEEGAASPPAYRAPRAPAADKGVSFDEFFGTPSSEPHASSVRPRGPRPPADDLDQFHAWLQNLKR